MRQLYYIDEKINSDVFDYQRLKDIHKYNEALTFSKEEVNKIYNDGALIIENKNYDEFFFVF